MTSLTKAQRNRAKAEVSGAFGFEPSDETIEQLFQVIQDNKAKLIRNDRVRGKIWELQLVPGLLAHVEYDRVSKQIISITPVPENKPQFTGIPEKKRRISG